LPATMVGVGVSLAITTVTPLVVAPNSSSEKA
jgi:hypothetical protein